MSDTIRADLKLLREKRNLSQEDAGRLIGVALNTWSRWECGELLPSPLARRALAVAFQTELDAMQPPPAWYATLRRTAPRILRP